MSPTGSGTITIGNDSSTTYLKGTVHLGEDSMIFEDTADATGTDVMYSSVGSIQIGKNSTDTTTVVGSLSVATPTLGSHATTKSYVDTKFNTLDLRLGNIEDLHHQGMSMQAATSSIVYGKKGFGVGLGANLYNKYAMAAGYYDRANNLALNVSSDMQDQVQFGVGFGW